MNINGFLVTHFVSCLVFSYSERFFLWHSTCLSWISEWLGTWCLDLRSRIVLMMAVDLILGLTGSLVVRSHSARLYSINVPFIVKVLVQVFAFFFTKTLHICLFSLEFFFVFFLFFVSTILLFFLPFSKLLSCFFSISLFFFLALCSKYYFILFIVVIHLIWYQLLFSWFWFVRVFDFLVQSPWPGANANYCMFLGRFFVCFFYREQIKFVENNQIVYKSPAKLVYLDLFFPLFFIIISISKRWTMDLKLKKCVRFYVVFFFICFPFFPNTLNCVRLRKEQKSSRLHDERYQIRKM